MYRLMYTGIEENDPQKSWGADAGLSLARKSREPRTPAFVEPAQATPGVRADKG